MHCNKGTGDVKQVPTLQGIQVRGVVLHSLLPYSIVTVTWIFMYSGLVCYILISFFFLLHIDFSIYKLPSTFLQQFILRDYLSEVEAIKNVSFKGFTG